jgi:glycine/D-amino acid oxidase-like deaminating enzyme
MVVGAGVVGASIAWHLAKANARVSVFEAAAPGGVATPASFAWINATWGNPEPYFRLRQRSIREWSRLAEKVAGIPFTRCGGLCFDMPVEELDAYAAQHAAWGYDIRRVTRAEAELIEPNVLRLPDRAVFVAEEAAVEPVAAALALLVDAQRLGAELHSGEAVRSLHRIGDRVAGVLTAAGLVEADEVVVAAGVATSSLTATANVDVTLDTPPGLIVHCKPHHKLLNGLVLAEELHMRQTAEGRIIAGADFGGGDPGADAESTARELFGLLRGMLRGGTALELDFHTIGYRPTPKDGFPIVGRAEGVDGLYLAVMHSGVTLAPAVGLFAAEELLTGQRDLLLAPYTLSRFSDAPAN